MPQPKITFPQGKIEAFCRKWKIKELALFGSVLREDFSPDSDIDVLVSFEPKGSQAPTPATIGRRDSQGGCPKNYLKQRSQFLTLN
jgi:hypothetical protein